MGRYNRCGNFGSHEPNKILSLTYNDLASLFNFRLKLTDLSTNHTLEGTQIGRHTFKSPGRILSLGDTHGIMCQKDHPTANLHDPTTDVIYTGRLYLKQLSREKNILFSLSLLVLN